MFGTIIMDAYMADESEKIATFIEEICSPKNSIGWASAGIYSFWDYYTKEILYIGLASDLYIRFKQHNGLSIISEKACKVKQITEYFKSHSKLGYSILVQSSLSQPVVHRNEAQYRGFLGAPKEMPIPNYPGEEGLENIRQAEGQLIESYKQYVGDIPPWNKIGGNVYSRKYASENNYLYVVRAFATVAPDNFLVSRSTISELAENATFEWFETQLHELRMMMLTFNMSLADAVKFQLEVNPYFQVQWNRILEEEYLEKELVV